MKKSMFRGALLAVCALATSSLIATADNRRGGSYASGEAVVFKDPNFRGAGLSVTGPIANMKYARFNDTISSIDVRGSWEICVDPNYRGKCVILHGSETRLANIRMNDNISSMRPVSGRYSRHDRHDRYGSNYGYDQRHSYAPIILYKDPNFRGRSTGLERGISNLREIGFNDSISSIAVNRGQWLICEHPDFRGRCEIIDADIGYLRDVGRLNDKVTSIRPYHDRGYTNTRW